MDGGWGAGWDGQTENIGGDGPEQRKSSPGAGHGSLLVPKSLQNRGQNSSPPQSPLAIGLIIPQRQAHACGLGNLVFLET